jgi:hypothetical protein
LLIDPRDHILDPLVVELHALSQPALAAVA